MGMFSQKIIFFSLTFFLVLFLIFYLGLKRGIFYKQKKEVSYSLKKNSQKIKSPCRELSKEAEALEAKPAASKDLQKLSALMDEPIDLVFQDIEGSVVDLYCLRNKKILLLNFWASWCPPCVQELPSLSKLAEKYKEDIFVVAISTEPLETVKNFLQRSFSDLSPHLKMAQMSPSQKAMYFPKDKLPVTYIFNKKGLLKWKELGAKDWSDQGLVQQLLQIP